MSTTTTTGTVDERLLSFGAGLAWRLRLSALGLAYVLLAVPALVLMCLTTAALGVAAVGVGLALLLLLVPLVAQLANAHRGISGRVLGVTIERPYASTGTSSGLGLLRSWAGDSARWRDYGWLWMRISVGWATAWIAFGLTLGVIWYTIFPFIYWVTPAGVFNMDYGIYTIDTQAESFLEWIFLVIVFALWWRFEPVLVRFVAQLDRSMLAPSRDQLEQRVAHVAQTRAETIDHSAAELRRIERDLHDGAQARLVSLGMTLGLAEQLLESDPEGAARLLAEARDSSTTALGDLRSVVRGIHPPVLADRGLAGAVQALALDMALPVSVVITLPGRPPTPIESAVYFAVAECLANVAKHASASRATVELAWGDGMLRAVITDDGVGGASPERGSGLAGLARRLDALDGRMEVVSPAGGPTVVTLEVACALSSARTTPSSATD
jgi:signal transduction histidine kinase